MIFIKKFLLFIPLFVIILLQSVTVGSSENNSSILLYFLVVNTIVFIYLMQYENYISYKYKNYTLTALLAFITPFLIVLRIFLMGINEIGTNQFGIVLASMAVMGLLGLVVGVPIGIIFLLLRWRLKKKYYTAK